MKEGLDLLSEEGRRLLKNLYSLSESTLLALNLIGEAFNQTIEGQVAVGSVVRNRVRYWRKSYQDIILGHNKGVFQFSCWLDKGSWLFDIWKGTVDLNEYERTIVRQIFYVSEGIVGDRIISNVERADHYYAPKGMRLNLPPWWAVKMERICKIGDHVFLQSIKVKNIDGKERYI